MFQFLMHVKWWNNQLVTCNGRVRDCSVEFEKHSVSCTCWHDSPSVNDIIERERLSKTFQITDNTNIISNTNHWKSIQNSSDAMIHTLILDGSARNHFVRWYQNICIFLFVTKPLVFNVSRYLWTLRRKIYKTRLAYTVGDNATGGAKCSCVVNQIITRKHWKFGTDINPNLKTK